MRERLVAAAIDPSYSLNTMQDPSQGVARELLPHCHLLSSYRYPVAQQVPLESITKWLLQAPKISKDTAPFFWTYLDRPADGSIFLVWQPLSSLGTSSASDGYVWAGAETVYQMEVPGGLILETFHFKTGFGPQEAVATHARKRYRLVPARHMHPDPLQVDPSLFIVHYSSCEPIDRIMANVIPLNMHIQQTMQTRGYLQSQGQIVRRDFMLHDRQSWPTINMPQGASRGMAPRQQQPYPGPPRIPQNVAYPPPAPQYQPHPSNKRARTNPPGQSGAPTAAPLDHGIEEEDTLRGDLFDQLTPREVSYCRYKQNHEWMEEIFSSVYSVNQIEAVDLGLGKPGSLGKLTEGIFEVPHYQQRPVVDYEKFATKYPEHYDPPRLRSKSTYVAKLDAAKAEEFRKRTSEHIEQTNAEIEKMKARHAKRMAKFQAGGIVTAGERRLRNAVTDPNDVGPELWRLEGRIDPDDESTSPDGQPYNQEKKQAEPKSRVSDIVAQVEASLGRTAAVVREVKRIQDGGLEEQQEKSVAGRRPSAINGALARDSQNGSMRGSLLGVDTEMGMDSIMDDGQAAGLLDQFHTGEAGSASAFSAHSTPQNFSTPRAMLHHQSAAGTPSALSNVNTASPQHAGMQSQGRSPQQHSYGGMDVEMGDAPEQGQNTEGASATGTDDWIVVPRGGFSPTRTAAHDTGGSIAVDQNTSTRSENTPSAQLTSNTEAPPASSGNTGAQAHQGHGSTGDNGGGGGFSFSHHQDDIHTPGFGNMSAEGAGDGTDLDLSMGMDLGMDDSAFGDAFHGVEGVGDGEGMGMGMVDEHGGM